MSNLTPMQRLVLRACRANPEAVNDDAVLQATVWQMEGWSDQRSLLENLRMVPRAETLSRRRRELIEVGILTASDEATEKRQEAFNNEREAHSGINITTAPKPLQENLLGLTADFRTMEAE